jgi:hypothetical protein
LETRIKKASIGDKLTKMTMIFSAIIKMNNSEQKLRFSSKITGVSLTLPMGWHRETEDNLTYPTEVYYQTFGEQYSPSITIRRIEIPQNEYHENNYQELSEIILAEQAKYSSLQPLEILEQFLEQIDNHSARIDIFKMVDQETGIPITQYQVTIQLETAVCGFIATMKTEDQDSYIPIFTEAIQSMKFNRVIPE